MHTPSQFRLFPHTCGVAPSQFCLPLTIVKSHPHNCECTIVKSHNCGVAPSQFRLPLTIVQSHPRNCEWRPSQFWTLPHNWAYSPAQLCILLRIILFETLWSNTLVILAVQLCILMPLCPAQMSVLTLTIVYTNPHKFGRRIVKFHPHNLGCTILHTNPLNCAY